MPKRIRIVHEYYTTGAQVHCLIYLLHGDNEEDVHECIGRMQIDGRVWDNFLNAARDGYLSFVPGFN